MRHGITGIDGQVEQDLFELDRIGLDPSRRGSSCSTIVTCSPMRLLSRAMRSPNHPMEIQ